MNQVMVEETAQDWMEPDPRIMETYVEQPLSTVEEDECMSYLSHYIVQVDQHIPVCRIAPVNAKARDIMKRHNVDTHKSFTNHCPLSKNHTSPNYS